VAGNAGCVSGWEKFILYHQTDGRVAIVTSNSAGTGQYYITAENSGGTVAHANRPATNPPGDWELFWMLPTGETPSSFAFETTNGPWLLTYHDDSWVADFGNTNIGDYHTHWFLDWPGVTCY
jgi:hypothetical protein